MHPVAHHHVAARNLADRPPAHHLDGDIVVHPIEPPEAAHGVPLEEKPHAGGQHDGDQNADGLGEPAVDEGDSERQGSGQQQDPDDRVLELLDEKPPDGVVFRRRDDIRSVQTAALLHLGRAQPRRAVFRCGIHGKRGF